MSEQRRSGRLSTLAAAYVVARRDFVAILFSRSFIFFLLGPLFPIVVGGLAGGSANRSGTGRPPGTRHRHVRPRTPPLCAVRTSACRADRPIDAGAGDSEGTCPG
jgi:hypothetical protein